MAITTASLAWMGMLGGDTPTGHIVVMLGLLGWDPYLKTVIAVDEDVDITRDDEVLWALAVLITLASAYWQRVSGPTYPLRGDVTIGGQEVGYRLTRSHGGATDQPVRLVVPGNVQGEVVWRRFPTSDPWQVIPMVRTGDSLVAALPHQPPAGKLEYQVRLRDGSGGEFRPKGETKA